MPKLNFFATCPKGLERLLFEELNSLKMQSVRETVAGVSFEGNFNDGLKACLWSRFASRILLELSEFQAPSDLELYMGAAGIPWENYFTPSETIAVEFNGMTDEIRNTQYGALKIKDAVCDRLLKNCGSRPNVDRENPDVRIYCHLERRGQATVAIDLSGQALLKREYSRHTGAAPLKENLAAAMVIRSGYAGANLFDPMCGSGTVLIEAAAAATDTAPGLKRRSYGFFRLKQFDAEFWRQLLAEASERSKRGFEKFKANGFEIIGFDRDPVMVEICNENLKRAGFDAIACAQSGDAAALTNPFSSSEHITVVTNPPYGKRMGNFNELISLYTALGEGLKRCFKGARAAVISSSAELLSCLRLHAARVYHLFNGALECQLRVFDISKEEVRSDKEEGRALIAEDFANRLKKNLTYMRKWAANTGNEAYRIYDSDVPEFPAAVDCYKDHYVIQAYAPKKQENERVHRRRVLDMISAVVKVTGANGDHVILKSREIKHGTSQYEKADELQNRFMTVKEGVLQFKVNLEDYLDTGLFLDARLIRDRIMKMAEGKRFLNLFCYTGSVTVAAAKGQARSSLSVDMSRTYLEWARENLELNGIGSASHRLLQADVLSWIAQDHPKDERFDLIYVDPPTFSNSKRMQGSFDVKRDQVALLSSLTRLMDESGTVIFCNNCRNFKLDTQALQEYGYECEDISQATLPRDFKRNAKIHSCFILRFERARMQKEPVLMSVAVAPKWQREVAEVKKAPSTKSYEEDFSRKSLGYRRAESFGRNFKRNEYGSGGEFKREFKDKTKYGNRSGFSKDRFAKGRYERGERNEAKVKPTGRVWGPEGIKDLK